MTAIDNAYRAARNAQKRLAGVSVVISDGSNLRDLTAIVGESRTEEVAEDNVITLRHRDYLIDILDIDFGAGPVLPARGWTIAEEIGEKTYTYSILPAFAGSFYEYSDRSKTTVRLHTKLLGIT